MPELPAEAVQAAAEAMDIENDHITYFTFPAMARVAVEAAVPFIAQHIGNLLDWRALEAAERDTWRCHKGDGGCHQAGAVEALAAAAREVRDMFTSGVGSPVFCPSAAPETTQSPETPSVAPVYPPGPDNPAETLSALRDRMAEALRVALDYAIVAEWICCEPLNPEHSLCCIGNIVRQGVRSLLDPDDEDTGIELARILDALLAVRDDELSRALRIADYHADQHRQAEAAIARVRELADRLCQEPHPTHDHICPDGLRAELLAALDGAGAVPEEQTGHSCGNCEGIDPASCINAPRPPASTTEETP